MFKKHTVIFTHILIFKKFGVTFVSIDEAEIDSSGEQPTRNSLSDWNGQGVVIYQPQTFISFRSIMPKKTHSGRLSVNFCNLNIKQQFSFVILKIHCKYFNDENY